MQRRQNPPSFERGDAAKIAGKIRKISKQFWQVTAIPQFQNTRVQYIIFLNEFWRWRIPKICFLQSLSKTKC